MRLIAFKIQGYRRFVEPTSVKLHGDLVAFVGPNEAGKSSLLRALSHLNNTDGFDANERPRRTTHSPELSWHFQLEKSDKEALAGLPDTDHLERAVVTKRADGQHTWEFEPRRPLRDRDPRSTAAEALSTLREYPALENAASDEDHEFDLDEYDRTIAELQAEVENYGSDRLDAMRETARKLRSIDVEVDVDEDGIPNAEHEAQREAWVTKRDQVASALDTSIASDAERSPYRRCFDALSPRLPRIELFGEEDRRLESSYDLNEVADDPPLALYHLADLASLDVRALRDEAAAGATADVATRRNAANRVLLDAFEQSWNQQGIAIQVEIQGSVLHINATTPEDNGLSELGERSDGLRWFAALLAFSHGWSEGTILLVDEIEQHLHYDAQADLVDVLARQSFTSKVIYTTHSFGCLPHDLGTGVRVVHPIDAATSELENGFWTKGSGFSPLLASMGAAAVTFTPTRHALIAEGPADAILLPTVLRQACRVDRLGFQVAPGLSSVAATGVAGLDAEAGRVGFLTDGDRGGRDLKNMLVGQGVGEDRILALVDGSVELEIEDLLDAEIYCAAINDELRCWQEPPSEVTPGDVPGGLRTKALEVWSLSNGVKAPDKVAVAQRVADRAAERDIFDADRIPMIKTLFGDICAALRLTPPR